MLAKAPVTRRSHALSDARAMVGEGVGSYGIPRSAGDHNSIHLVLPPGRPTRRAVGFLRTLLPGKVPTNHRRLSGSVSQPSPPSGCAGAGFARIRHEEAPKAVCSRVSVFTLARIVPYGAAAYLRERCSIQPVPKCYLTNG